MEKTLWKNRAVWLVGLTILLLALCAGRTALADNIDVGGDGWTGRLTDVTTGYDLDPDFDLDIEWWGPFPYPSFSFNVTITLGVKGNFELEVTKGNLNGGVNQEVTYKTNGLYHQSLNNWLLSRLPSAYGVGLDVFGDFYLGATGPIEAKGSFNNSLTLKIGTGGVDPSQTTDVTFTQVKPGTDNREVMIWLGTNFGTTLKLGEIGYKSLKVGPLMTGTFHSVAAGRAKAMLEKNKFSTLLDYFPSHPDSLHTCTEAGKAGCVTATTSKFNQNGYDIGVKASITIVKEFSLFNKHWVTEARGNTRDIRTRHQSLTFNEPMRDGACTHMVYRVPAAVWRDHAMTRPAAAGTDVSANPPLTAADMDANVLKYASGRTGTDPSLPANRVDLYLPWKEGRYELKASMHGIEGTGQQRDSMRRSANDQVDIILADTETTSRSVSKTWDIDYEHKDRPDEIQVAVQALHYSTGLDKVLNVVNWEDVDVATLSAANNWSYTFDGLPKYDITEDGERKEIKYRVRELSPGDEAPKDRIVKDTWDLDNQSVWDAIKKQFSWDKIWEVSLTTDYVKKLAAKNTFPSPRVSYHVDAYVTSMGENVDEHETRYAVTYDENGNDVSITNTAMESIKIYKRWVMLGDAETPDNVYLVLTSRIKSDYTDMLQGTPAERFAKLWLPILNPLSGDKINLLKLAGLDTLAELDFWNLASIPITIGKAKGGGQNPLTDWRVGFEVKKYGFLGVPGVPVEFQGAEVSSQILQDVLTFILGFEIPVSFNPFDTYVTVPGKAYKIPVLDKDWEKTSNVINTWYKGDGSGEKPKAIGGTKYWVNDKESDRPDYLTIHVKDGENEIGSVKISKSDKDNQGKDSWAWALTGENLDPEKTYTVTEEYPEGFANKDKYHLEVKGHDLFNTLSNGKDPVLRGVKYWDLPESAKEVLYRVTAHLQLQYKREGGEPVALSEMQRVTETNNWTVTFSLEEAKRRYAEAGLEGEIDYSRLSVGEYGGKQQFDQYYAEPVYSVESDGTPVWTYAVTNKLIDHVVGITVEKVWKREDETSRRPDSVTVHVLREGQQYRDLTLNEGNGWKASLDIPISDTKKPDVDNQYYTFSVKEEPVDGYTSSLEVSDDVTIGVGSRPSRHDYNYTLTNTWTGNTDKVDVTGTITWLDDDDAQGLRPQSVQVSVMNSNSERVSQQTVESGVNEFHVYGLPKNAADGSQLSYYFVQDGLPEGYRAAYDQPSFDAERNLWSMNVNNTLERYVTDVAVNKVWDDENDREGIRPESVSVTLYRVAGESGETQEVQQTELNAENEWKRVFRDLPTVDEQGGAYSYYVEEAETEGYRTELSGSQKQGFTFINTIRSKTIDIPVSKKWRDNENAWGTRTDSVVIELLADGEPARGVPAEGQEQGEPLRLTLSADNDWQGTFEQVPVFREDSEIVYTVREENTPRWYEADISGSAEEGFTVSNELESLYFLVIKNWDDDGAVSDRPGSITVGILKDGEPAEIVLPDGTVASTMTLSEEGGWVNLWTVPIVESTPEGPVEVDPARYTLVEEETEKYTCLTEYETEEEDHLTVITMTNTPGKKLIIRKVWTDGLNARRTRPDELRLTLTGDLEGEPYTRDIVLTAADSTGPDVWETVIYVPRELTGITLTEDETPSGYLSYILPTE